MFVRVTAVRVGIDVATAAAAMNRRPDEDVLNLLVSMDANPEVEPARTLYRERFRSAIEETLAGLTKRERSLLRLHFLDGLNIDAIASIYRVHRATVARWLVAIRNRALADPRGRLALHLGGTPSELRSLISCSGTTSTSAPGESWPRRPEARPAVHAGSEPLTAVSERPCRSSCFARPGCNLARNLAPLACISIMAKRPAIFEALVSRLPEVPTTVASAKSAPESVDVTLIEDMFNCPGRTPQAERLRCGHRREVAGGVCRTDRAMAAPRALNIDLLYVLLAHEVEFVLEGLWPPWRKVHLSPRMMWTSFILEVPRTLIA